MLPPQLGKQANMDMNFKSRRHRYAVILMFLGAILLRGAILWARQEELEHDPDAYRLIANNLLLRHTYSISPENVAPQPTAYRPPLYPLMLALASTGKTGVANSTVAVFHLLLGVLTIGLTFWIATLWRLGNWSFFAAALVACDPILLHQSTLVMTETMATLLAIVALLCFTRLARHPCWWRAGLCGASMATAALCRPTFLVWLVLAAPAVGLLEQEWKKRFHNLLSFTLFALACLTPWIARNAQQIGYPIIATTHGGYTLWLGNNNSFYEHIRQDSWDSVWDFQQWQRERPPRPGQAITQHHELSTDQQQYEQALATIRSQPTMFVWSSLVKLGRLWRPWPHATTKNESGLERLTRYIIGAWYGILFMLAVLASMKLRTQLWRSPWLWGVLACGSFSLIHSFFWSNMRMRAPLMPFLCLLAAQGVVFCCHSMNRRKSCQR